MNHLTSLYIHGNDAKNFLQGKVTCDINLLTPLTAQPSACCNLQGRIIALFFIIIWQDGYLLLLPEDILKKALKHFKKYAVFSKVLFEHNPDLKFLGFSEKPTSTVFYNCFDNLLLTEHNEYTKNLPHSLDDNAWHYQQLLHGFPDLTPETQETFLPHRIGLQNIDGVLNFKKGCYLGQEIIARTHFKATLKHTVCLCNHPIGEMIDSAISPEKVTHFLCVIKNEDLEEISSHIVKQF